MMSAENHHIYALYPFLHVS